MISIWTLMEALQIIIFYFTMVFCAIPFIKDKIEYMKEIKTFSAIYRAKKDIRERGGYN